ncbi:hypothetical protein CASFOL_006848 [Castilleja foliolosa]|uniref:65-kDa microtubule-associated protein 3 n=1 Tax=Castilleja foliolosa TaxID=1961234 RepID=A0ABD3E7J1_9LAMI
MSTIEPLCGSLLHELQIIWNEIGESDAERGRVLLEIEQECLEVYRRKVDHANKCRAKLRQAIADAEAELAVICSAMGELPVHIRQSDPNPENLKDELRAILPQIEEMRKRRVDRKNQFIEVSNEIRSIENEIYGLDGFASNEPAVDESDLSMRKLEELHGELQGLRKEKSERLKMVFDCLNCLYSLCMVLGLDFKKIAIEIHPSLGESEGSKNISNTTIEQLGIVIQRLKELKIQRMQDLQDLTASLLELWHLMDTPTEEQQLFQKVTCKLAAAEDEITEADMLSVDHMNYVRAEVFRLEELKASKMKELVLKKKAELEVICRNTRLIPDKNSALEAEIDAIESGAVDAAYLLEQIEIQIAGVKEDALNRKEILEKVEKWMAACEEESWLEEYNRDDNRYNAGRGTHLALKRAEKARVLVNKLPAIVDALASKVIAWENEEGKEFFYNGVRLLSMLEAYIVLREQKEIERKRQRDQKKLQGQLLAEQEALYGAKPSPKRIQSVKKEPRSSSCGGGAGKRKLSLGAPMLQTSKRDTRPSAKATPNTHKAKTNVHTNKDRLKDDRLSAFPTGRRVSDMADRVPLKHYPKVVNETELRKPFTPISTTNPSKKSNTANNFRDPNKKHDDTLHKTLVRNNNTSSTTTPPKIISRTDEENITPQTTRITLYSTPSTLFAPMQTELTPPISTQTAIMPTLTTIKSVGEEIEYSFEEKRAGFVMRV